MTASSKLIVMAVVAQQNSNIHRINWKVFVICFTYIAGRNILRVSVSEFKTQRPLRQLLSSNFQKKVVYFYCANSIC